ncbi:MAG TPA: hypothetical protein VLS89_20955, partial [Candidatus Nanopelagicales bacterium]|nr:hypothetical protein [Candidatus Nanopelagicales bacterium]
GEAAPIGVAPQVAPERAALAAPGEAPAVSPAEAAASAPANPAPAAAVELRLEAEAALGAVRAPGLIHVDLQDRGARIQVAPWTGTLLVEVSFAGGGAAVARFEQDGPRVARISAPSPAAPAPRRPELHENPY